MMNDILPVAQANPDVNFRYIVGATEPIPGSWIPIFINPDDLQKGFDIGYNDGVKAVNGTDSIFEEYHKHVEDYQTFTLREGFD